MRRVFRWILLLAASAAPYPALAQTAGDTTASDTNVQLQPQGWLNWKHMTGDWGGLRNDLLNDGITIRGDYVAEIAGNPVGGAEQGGAYAHEIMLGTDIDSKLFGWSGGTLHFTLTERAGSSLSKDKIHNLLTVQEIYGDGQTTRITELSYEQKIGKILDVAAGRLNTEEDFASSPIYFGDALYCDFQSNAICGTPIAVPINTPGYVAYPASTWGARIKFYPTSGFYAETGAYEVNPTILDASNGFKLSTNGATGVEVPVELGLTVGQGEGQYLGNYRVGAYYDNSDFKRVMQDLSRFVPAGSPILSGLPQSMTAGQYGFWVLADQMVQRDPGTNNRGTTVFAALNWGDKRSALVNWYGEAGVVRHGTFAGRDNDTVALGFAIASINGTLLDIERGLQAAGYNVPGTAREFMVEANYGYQLSPWLNLRPGMQYVWHPNGEAEIRNALVLDLKIAATF
jgi:porin